MINRLFSAESSDDRASKRAVLGVSLPMDMEIARENADVDSRHHAEIASDGSGANSKVKVSTVTPIDAGNSVLRYPSQCSWPGIVPTAPAADISLPKNTRQAADPRPARAIRLHRAGRVASFGCTHKQTRGYSRCDYLRLRRSHVSPLAGLQPVAIQRLNRACLAQARAQVRLLSPVGMPQPALSSVQASTCSTARTTRANVTKPTSAPIAAQPINTTTKPYRGLGGFFMPRRLTAPLHLIKGHEPEGTFDVQ